ncbi:MAG: energy-coupling factor transporter transmembrane component T [Bacillota bacterium]|nr:energy-coupling factor transporter transmembrane component T [Bacillota bacterium]
MQEAVSPQKKAFGLSFDPRTKLFLLLIIVTAAMTAPALTYTLGLVMLIAAFALLCGKVRTCLSVLLGYGIFYLLTLLVLDMPPSTLQATLIAFFALLHKVYPCSIFAGIMISTTKVGAFLTAMNRMHVPRKLVIPLAVMLRYLPAIREDRRFIKDAMRLRGISGGFFAHPVRTVECIYVPMMMAASKTADELSIASVTRGIENPAPRTGLDRIRFRIRDFLILLVFSAYLTTGIFNPEVFL